MNSEVPAGSGEPGARVITGGTPDGKPALNFDDDEIYSGRSARAHTGGTTASVGGDSGRIAPPTEQLSSSNGPSDPDALTQHRGGGA